MASWDKRPMHGHLSHLQVPTASVPSNRPIAPLKEAAGPILTVCEDGKRVTERGMAVLTTERTAVREACEHLIEAGIDHVFGIPGGCTVELFNALGDYEPK